MGLFDNLFFRISLRINSVFYATSNDITSIPVIINNFNRYEYLLKLISWLEANGIRNIHIIDNCSSYKPLLEYYKSTPYTVYRLDNNVGHLALWKTIIYKKFHGSHYIYTDPDVLPVHNNALEAINFLIEKLRIYKQYDKIGFGLKIDDLPSHYPLKEKVIKWEKQFWENMVEHDIYDASIDTTFALYRPNCKGGAELKALRTGGRFVARHLPWYIDPKNLSEEEKFYIENASSSSSWSEELKGSKKEIYN